MLGKRMQQADIKEKADIFERVVVKNGSVYHYMKVSLVLEDAHTKLTAVEVKHFLITGLKSLYGEVGAAFPFDLLTFEEDSRTAVLRVYNRGLVRLWSSLTLTGFFRNRTCAFRVHQVSPYLLALTGNSRDLELDRPGGPAGTESCGAAC